MKAIHKISRSLSFLLPAITILSLSGLFLISCEKETVYVEVPVEIEVPVDTCNQPDEMPDLMAWLDPLAQALFVLPEYVETSLDQLNAMPLTDGTYFMQGVNPYGEIVDIQFHIVVVEIQDLQNISIQDEPATPDLIKEFEEKGTRYRLFKNAECGNISPGFTGECTKGADGTSYRYVYYDTRKCVRGNSFCTEALTVFGKKVTYVNDNCEGVIQKEESEYFWQCQ